MLEPNRKIWKKKNSKKKVEIWQREKYLKIQKKVEIWQ
jgi:hypothetical protein